VPKLSVVPEPSFAEPLTAPDDGNRLPTLRTVAPEMSPVNGWPTLEDAEALFRAAAAAESGCIVEIGSHHGQGTLALCAGSSVGAKLPVYAIDPHEGTTGTTGGTFGPEDRAAFFRNLSKTDLIRYVRLVNTTSTVAAAGWREPISLLVIAGDHRCGSVYADFAAWQPHLRPGATVAFQSPANDDPNKVIETLVSQGALYFLGHVRKLLLFRSTGHRTPIGARAVGRSAAIPVAPRARAGKTGYTVRLEQIGYHMYYGGGGAYLYQPIPKCACTTIKTLLLQVEGLPVDDNVWRRHQKEYNRFPGTHHLTMQEQLDVFEGRTDAFKFVIVRNPYARLASAYCDKVLLKPAAYLIRKIRKSAADQGIVLSDPITFEQFVSVISRQSLEEMDPHYRPQYYEGRFAIIKYDFIGRMEAMPHDLVYALERIGSPESIIARANERYNVAGSSFGLWEAVSPEVHRLFLKTFDIDFDTLQYSRRLPRTPSPDYA
jgi:hypothetical protein